MASTTNAKETELQRQIVNAFNKIGWHDSKLLNVAISDGEAAEHHHVTMEIRLLEHDYQKLSTLIFEDCFAVNLGVDLHAKHSCSDQIAVAKCSFNSEFKESLRKREVPRLEIVTLQEYLHFEIVLIPPAGKIMILARNFVLRRR